ncbi:hypothetical protein VMCG_05397 [Cytospora schulzeri]|uniref:Uncharacterized protein n=1 Tax=Cytospora schulzeri TaxID=448051 RepID=A0A423WK70_9PEZI|nr:hypothetical protein VMCG_05397 [Valsa malicola]
MSDQSSVLSGTLGTILGYLGGEVAEEVLFERLLWPERFYNDFSSSIFIKGSLLFSMGGPLHAAALKTLDQLREQGLYYGNRRGNFLGTPFYDDLKLSYESSGNTDAVRNAFWVRVSRCVSRSSLSRNKRLPKFDMEDIQDDTFRFRSLQTVNYITLGIGKQGGMSGQDSAVTYVQEDKVTWRTVLGILASESMALATAILAIFIDGWWVAIYMVVPLILKMAALIGSVSREGLERLSELEKRGSLDTIETFRIFDSTHGYLVITGPKPVVTQFFRHYGHPTRYTTLGRFREVLSIVIVYSFVLYFPFGLITNIWMDSPIQYLWLAYQLYTVFAMHIVRLLGWQGCGRTEERVARELMLGKTVRLQSQHGEDVEASLWTTFVPNISSGEETVRRLMGE